MIEQVKSDEMAPPREVRVGGIFEVPWQGFHADALIGTRRFMEDMRGEVDACDGFFIKFEDKFFRDENKLGELCAKLEGLLEGNWRIIPWFVENAWFFDLLKFEEYSGQFIDYGTEESYAGAARQSVHDFMSFFSQPEH